MDGQEPAISDHEALTRRGTQASVHSTQFLRRYQRREGVGVGPGVPRCRGFGRPRPAFTAMGSCIQRPCSPYPILTLQVSAKRQTPPECNLQSLQVVGVTSPIHSLTPLWKIVRPTTRKGPAAS